MAKDENLEPQFLTVWSAFADLDATSRQPREEAFRLLQRIIVNLGTSHDELQYRHAASKEQLAKADERIRSLERRLTVSHRIQTLASALSLIGAILIGFGVNYLTGGATTPGLAMLIMGVLMQLSSLAAPFIDGERVASVK